MRIYLAATQDLYGGNAQVQTERMLVSYWGKTADTKMPAGLAAGGNPPDWCLDSGAHFYLGAFHKNQKLEPVEKVEAHIQAICDYVRNCEVKPYWVAEMDLQDIYGMDIVEGWREKFFYPLEKDTGVRVAYVHHASDTPATWDEMLDNANMNFLAVSIPKGQSGRGAGPGIDLTPWVKMVTAAYEAGKPVHGFACVKARKLRSIPFWSVDSTSWGAGSMFGTVSSFNARTGIMQEKPAGRREYRSNQKAALGNLLTTRGKVQLRDMLGNKSGGDVSNMYQNAVHAYGEMERWYTSYWKAKGIDWQKKLKE